MSKRHIHLLSIAVTALALSTAGCASNNAHTEQQQVNKTTSGTAAGAATGAIIGAAVGNVPGAIIGGAAGGAVAGTGAGYALDNQEASLRSELRSTGVSVVEIENSNDIILVMPSAIHFKTGSATLSPAFQNVLTSVAKVMKSYKFTVAQIPGHADSIGSRQYNMKLSASRAQAVANYLVSQGIESQRVVVEPYGEFKPAFSNTTKQGRAMNRRVEIILHTPPTTNVDRIPPVSGNKK